MISPKKQLTSIIGPNVSRSKALWIGASMKIRPPHFRLPPPSPSPQERIPAFEAQIQDHIWAKSEYARKHLFLVSIKARKHNRKNCDYL